MKIYDGGIVGKQGRCRRAFPWAPSAAQISSSFRVLGVRSADRALRDQTDPPLQNVWSSPSHDGCAALLSPTPPFLRALAEAPGQDFAPKVRREMGCDPRAAAKEQPGAWAERAERVSSYHDKHGIAAETLKRLRVQVSTPQTPQKWITNVDDLNFGKETWKKITWYFKHVIYRWKPRQLVYPLTLSVIGEIC